MQTLLAEHYAVTRLVNNVGMADTWDYLVANLLKNTTLVAGRAKRRFLASAEPRHPHFLQTHKFAMRTFLR